jgi:hypothetical protein
MTIYVPLLYICMGLKCVFFQSENYTTDEQDCEQEIAKQKIEYTKQGAKVDAICVDINIKNERKKNEFIPQFHT